MYTWTGKPLHLRVSPSDAPTTVHGHRQTHKCILRHTVTKTYTPPSTTQTDTQTYGNTQADTYKHTQRHIKACIASQRHTSTHRDT